MGAGRPARLTALGGTGVQVRPMLGSCVGGVTEEGVRANLGMPSKQAKVSLVCLLAYNMQVQLTVPLYFSNKIYVCFKVFHIWLLKCKRPLSGLQLKWV